ncbi:MAG TPA: hypothetical protein VME41_18295 [Stellaceae bacterium]|nr:hypothetical protein [Stellaceae bacterium]
MSQSLRDRYANGYEDRSFAETPFLEIPAYEAFEEPQRGAALGEFSAEAWSASAVPTPFLSIGAPTLGESELPPAEIANLAELATELKDSEFRDALEELADEALELHADQLAGEYGDREMRDLAAERLLDEHFAPLAAQTDAALDRFFERLEGHEPGALTEMEVERLATEALPTAEPISPAAEQFLGGLLKKAGKLVSAAIKSPVKLIGKGLAFAGKLAFGPFAAAFKKLARFLIKFLTKHALNKMPPQARALAQKLSDRLFHELGDAHEGEAVRYEQTEAESLPTASDIARLEAEFDLHAAQLALTPDEGEADHLVSTYGEAAQEAYEGSPLETLDRARAELADGLARLQPGESPQPVMEQFLPALAAIWPALKGGIALIGRPRVVNFVSGLLAHLIKPVLGADAAKMLAPAMASTGLGLVGLETAPSDPHVAATEALAATIEDAATRLAELPPHVFDNDTTLDAAVRESFEEAASSYFPDALIKPELREAADQPGVWHRLPRNSHRKRYAKYSHAQDVTITPRAAGMVHSFGGGTLKDHLRDRMDLPAGRAFKGRIHLIEALPGARAATIARAEGIRKHDLHPLTAHAAGVLLGPNAGLGDRHVQHASPPRLHRLHVRQRLYYIEPPNGRQHLHHRHHTRRAHTELTINLRKGEIRLWLYVSERLCQQIAAALGQPGNPTAAFRLVQPLVRRAAGQLRAILAGRHLPPDLRVISEVPNFDAVVPRWLVSVGSELADKIDEWASHQVAQYLANHADEFRRLVLAQHDGLTLRLTMSIPGVETLRMLAQGHRPAGPHHAAWFHGTPHFAVVAHPGYAIK